MDAWPNDPAHNAAAMALQIYGGSDPDGSRYVARRVCAAVFRAGVRPTDGLPTPAEVERAREALERRQIRVEADDVYAALLDALCPSLEAEEGSPAMVDSECGICRLEGPDRFGNYDLIPDPRCEVH